MRRVMDFFMELPPRTRRIQLDFDSCEKKGGTTSAYAENTDSKRRGALSRGELPPRTRRIPPRG